MINSWDDGFYGHVVSFINLLIYEMPMKTLQNNHKAI